MCSPSGKKAQQLARNFIYVLFVMFALFIAYKMLAPMLPTFLAGKNVDLQMVIMLILPAMFFFFIIYIFKVFKDGDGE